MVSKQAVIGIDIGSLDSVVSYVKRGNVDVVQNEVSERKTPSLVGFNDKERLLGSEAVAVVKSNFKNTCRNFKQIVGRKMTDPEIEREKMFSLCPLAEDDDGYVGYDVSYHNEKQVMSASRVFGMYLHKMKDISEKWCNGPVSDAVISVPSYFSDVHRQAVLDACNCVGLNSLRLMNETSAIALAYGIYRVADFDPETPCNVAFVSAGHSATSVCIAQFYKDRLNIVGEYTDRSVSGREMDRALIEYFAENFKKKYSLDILKSTKAVLKIEEAIAKTKKTLSSNDEGQVSVDCIMEDEDLKDTISRAEFEKRCESMSEKLGECIDAALKQTELTIEQIQFVEIIGGCSRVPWVQNKIQEKFNGKDLSRTLNADECVARGCALQAAMLSPLYKVKDFNVNDFTPHSIQVGWMKTSSEEAVQEEDGDAAMADTDNTDGMQTAALFPKKSSFNTVKMISFYRKKPFEIKVDYDAANSDLVPGTSQSVGSYVINVPAGEESQKIKVRSKLNLSGLFSIDQAHITKEVEVEETVKEKRLVKEEPKENGEPAAEEKKDEKMETEGEKKEGSEEKAEEKKEEVKKEDKYEWVEVIKKKKVTTKTEVPITRNNVPGLSTEKLSLYRDLESAMQAESREMRETEDARNDLETYILDMRGKVDISGQYADCMKEEDVKNFQSLLTSSEDWLYDNFDGNKVSFVEKMNELTLIGNPVVVRYQEHSGREEACAQLLATIQQSRQQAGSMSEDYAHIAVDKKQAVIDECNKAEEWLTENQRKQALRPKHEDAIMKVQEIRDLASKIQVSTDKVMSEPKPAPPKEEKKEETPAPSENEDVKMETETEPAKDSPPPQESSEAPTDMDVD